MNVYKWMINILAKLAIFLWWNATQIVDKDPGFSRKLILIIFGAWIIMDMIDEPDKPKLRNIKKGSKNGSN